MNKQDDIRTRMVNILSMAIDNKDHIHIHVNYAPHVGYLSIVVYPADFDYKKPAREYDPLLRFDLPLSLFSDHENIGKLSEVTDHLRSLILSETKRLKEENESEKKM